MFLIFEARRYRYFNVWRARARWMEKNFYAPMLRGESLKPDASWSRVLAQDYCEPQHHITFARAIGRRLRRNYIWILGIQTLAYYGKIASTRCQYLVCPNWYSVPVLVPYQAS